MRELNFVIFIISQHLWTPSKLLLTLPRGSNATLPSTSTEGPTLRLMTLSQENRGLTAQEARIEATTAAETSRTERMAHKENSEVAAINAISTLKTQTTQKTLSNPATTSTKRDLITIGKDKALLTVDVASTVGVANVAGHEADTETGKKQDPSKKLSLQATRRSLM